MTGANTGGSRGAGPGRDDRGPDDREIDSSPESESESELEPDSDFELDPESAPGDDGRGPEVDAAPAAPAQPGGRREAGQERVIFGVHPVEEALMAHHRDLSVLFVAEGTRSPDIERVVRLARDRAIPIELRPRQLVADLAGATAHQGLVAVTGAYRYVAVDDIFALAEARAEAPLLLVLDGITDPHNFGALVRSAEVLGAHGLVIAERHAAPVNGTVVKASAGATERMRIARVTNLLRTLDGLRARALMVLGAAAPPPASDPRRSPALDALDLRGPVAVVIGAEGQGMREAVTRRCDGVFHIPQAGVVSSLNASVAGAIALYEVARQRRRPADGDA